MAGTRITDGNVAASRDLDAKIPQAGASTPATTARQILTMVENPQTDSYTLELLDAFNTITMNKATATNLTVPPNSSIPYEVGTIIGFRRIGAGVMTFVAGVGVTITPSLGALTDAGLNVFMILEYLGSDNWSLQNGQPVSITSGNITTALGYTPASNVTEWSRVVAASPQVFNAANTNFADVTALLFPVILNVRSEWRAMLYIDSANTTEGIALSINGPALTTCRYFEELPTTTSATTVRSANAYDTNGANTTSITNGWGTIEGRILCSASGNVILRLRTEGNSIDITVLAGSYIEYRTSGT